MTHDEFATAIGPVARHGLTVIAGLLAAKGFTGGAGALDAYASSIIAGGIALTWSYAEKSKLIAGVIDAAPFDEVEELARTVIDFRSNGASPALVAHLTATMATIVGAELQQALAPAPQAQKDAAQQAQKDAAQQASGNSAAPQPGPFLAAETHGDMA